MKANLITLVTVGTMAGAFLSTTKAATSSDPLTNTAETPTDSPNRGKTVRYALAGAGAGAILSIVLKKV